MPRKISFTQKERDALAGVLAAEWRPEMAAHMKPLKRLVGKMDEALIPRAPFRGPFLDQIMDVAREELGKVGLSPAMRGAAMGRVMAFQYSLDEYRRIFRRARQRFQPPWSLSYLLTKADGLLAEADAAEQEPEGPTDTDPDWVTSGPGGLK